MALVDYTGWENGHLGPFDSHSGAAVSSTSGLSMDGNYCLALTAQTDYWKMTLTAATEHYFSFWYRTINTSDHSLMILFNNSSPVFQLRTNATTGIIKVLVEGTTVATASASLGADTTYKMSVYFKQATSGGRIVVKKGNSIVIDYTGNTDTGALTNFNVLHLGYYPSYYGYAYYDNLIIDDATYPTNTAKIQWLAPTSSGTTSQWTASTGANYTCVDEVPNSAADYVYTNTNDQLDQYGMGNMTGTISSVLAVKVQALAWTDGTATPTNIKLNVRSGGSDYLSGDVTIPASEGEVSNIWETNPDTSGTWTEATVNAVESGVKSAA